MEVNKAIETMEKFFAKAANGEGMMGGFVGSYRAARKMVGKVDDAGAAVLDDAGNQVMERAGIWQGIKEGHRAAPDEWDVGGYSVKKMAGSYIGISAAGRVASGGGLYKDGDGNTNIIGVPLI